ncbi:hypothetical protein FQZ97_568110 [compost metagenome]
MKCVLRMPRRSASWFMSEANALSLPPTASARATDASLPDCTIMPWFSSSTVTGLRGSMNMREPPVRQACSETGTVCSSVRRFSSSALNTTYAVMILVSEAGSTFMSGLEAARVWPLFTSITIQALAAIVGAGTADTSPTGTTPEADGAAAAGAAGAAAGACCCCAQAGIEAASIADSTAPVSRRRVKTTGE